jgi:uracil-DNA glycosylase family 4
MSLSPERAQLLRQIRAEVADLIQDGVQFVRVPVRAAPPRAAVTQVAVEVSALAAVREELGDCRRCGLCQGRTQLVFGEGNPHPRVVFVGEGPGAEEDRTGRPFVGPAGELLTRMIEACGWKRADVYICNIVKCRPPGNRDPEPDEVEACRPFLERQLRALSPEVLVSLGRPATSALLGRSVSITQLRGRWQQWREIPLMPTFHPAYVLRNYTLQTRQQVWDDLRAVHARLAQRG